ncbi:hypothetical protein CDEF62S_04048 [Castellaniella defragrans]
MPVPAGVKTGSVCARICARRFRPQPRYGPGVIADKQTGLATTGPASQPTGGLFFRADGHLAFGAFLLPINVLISTKNPYTNRRPNMNPQPCTLRAVSQVKPLLYGSVCSGIEAVSLAWQPFGLEAAWFAEIEPFPSAVLAHHYPHVPNLGNMTEIVQLVRAGTVPAPDILVGGTPCQSFSVRGARRGLNDPRGAFASPMWSLPMPSIKHAAKAASRRPHLFLGKRSRRPQRPQQCLRVFPGGAGRRKPCAPAARGNGRACWLCVWTPPPHRLARARRSRSPASPTP